MGTRTQLNLTDVEREELSSLVRASRTPRPVKQSRQALGPMTPQPLVSGLSADPEPLTQRRDTLASCGRKSHELFPLRHDRPLLPRHPAPPSR